MVNFWGHLFNPFSQGGAQLTKKEKKIACLGWLLAPLLIIPGFLAFYGISYYFKNRALKNLTHQPTEQQSSVSQIAKNNIRISHHSIKGLESSSLARENESINEVEGDQKSNTVSIESAEDLPNLTNTVSDSPYLVDYSSLNKPKSLQEAAEMILLTAGFETPFGAPKNYYDKKKQQDTVEEIQGTPALRRAVRCATYYFPEAITPTVLRQYGQRLEQYHIFLIKKISHVFDLKGRVQLPSGRELNLEGFSEDFTIPLIAASFKEFSRENSDNDWVVQHLLSTLTCDLTSDQDIQSIALELQNSNQNRPIAFGSGFDWHSTITGFMGNIGFIANRGYFCNISGVAFYRIENKHLLTEASLQDICRRHYQKGGDFFGHKAFINELGAEYLFTAELPKQKSGNCTYRSTEAYLFTLLAFHQLLTKIPEYFLKGTLDTVELKLALESAKIDFHKWQVFARVAALKELDDEINSLSSSEASPKKIYEGLKAKIIGSY